VCKVRTRFLPFYTSILSISCNLFVAAGFA
jgi:hypothetical protein